MANTLYDDSETIWGPQHTRTAFRRLEEIAKHNPGDTQLGLLVGLQRQSPSAWRNGLGRLKNSHLITLCNALRVPVPAVHSQGEPAVPVDDALESIGPGLRDLTARILTRVYRELFQDLTEAEWQRLAHIIDSEIERRMR